MQIDLTADNYNFAHFNRSQWKILTSNQQYKSKNLDGFFFIIVLLI